MTDKIIKLGYLAVGTRLRQIIEKLYVDGDKIYKESNIDFKASWFSVYYILATADQPKTVLDLSDEIGFTHITIKNVVRELESAGLVNINVHPTDKRSKHISLSANGQKLFEQLQKVWLPFADTLKNLLDAGHPDFINIINRIDKEVSKNPIYERIKAIGQFEQVQVLDYKPSLKHHFTDLVAPWLSGVLNGTLEKEDEFTVYRPDEAYLLPGGFLFFAMQDDICLGTVALKRLDENTFEFAKLFISPDARKMGIATKLIERCISRCKENNAKELWLQTTMRMPDAHKLYYKFGFEDRSAPQQMEVLERTEKIMVMDL
jgi:DNA-binding MarR family transcriptional regulator/GNAT superfamily N-acetyltransferase